MVKVSIVKMNAKAAHAHIKYLGRDGTDKDGERGQLFDRETDRADVEGFEKRGREDRHQFRVIVSPEDARDMADLTAFTRELVTDMEKDLGTGLDWVAVNHFDTGQPHTHLLIRGARDDGKDLVMPRDYISRGIRERAQALVSLELGPVSELAGRTRFAHMVSQERLTELDRGLLQSAPENIVDLSGPARKSQVWRRQLQRARLKQLGQMGLATPLGNARWRLDPDLRMTLTRMGERGDIIKTLHRAMRDTGNDHIIDGASIFDPGCETAKVLTGEIVAKGVADDIQDRSYLVIDNLGGKLSYINLGPSERLAEFNIGMIVTAHPSNREPRPSDQTIDKIASKYNGRYSAVLHMDNDPAARPQFVEAHIRRLEALRRAGHVTRHKDGSWRIPKDYLARAANFEKAGAMSGPADVRARSRLTLKQMQTAMGRTWLDEQMVEKGPGIKRRGFCQKLDAAKQMRMSFLGEAGVVDRKAKVVTPQNLDELLSRDLKAAGTEIEKKIGKPYQAVPSAGKLTGVYKERLERPSGRYAVIERARDFTLVPWRQVMDRNLGQSITGRLGGPQISWTLTRGRNPGI